MAELERKYADKPVHFFHVLCGENPLQALDYKKHYRSDAPHLLDTTYAVSEAYDAGSWPTTVIVDPEGRIAGRWLMVSEPEKWRAARATLEELLPRAKGGPPKGAYCVGDKCFVRSGKDVFESQPAMIADGGGRLHLVFTREQSGSGDLFHRTLDGGQWSTPTRITRSAADDYSPSLCADGRKGLRLVWCSNRAASGKYDVWTMRFDGSTWSDAQRVTEADDDAAHPRGAVDTQGNFWVAYYRWIPWSAGVSRDREIFARYHDGEARSEEMQISPTDVPNYEDHADPAIAADAGGNVWVAWAWDTHPDEKRGWSYPPTYGSAIFARQLRASSPPSRLRMVAMRSPSVQAAMKNPTWAFLPEVHCRGARVWFAFEAHTPGGSHAGAVTSYQPGEGFPAPTRLGINDRFVCAPRLIEDREGDLFALWSAKISARYTVHLARLSKGGAWGAERLVWAEPDADVRFAAGAFDADNKLWLAAVRIALGKSDVVVRQVGVPGTAGG